MKIRDLLKVAEEKLFERHLFDDETVSILEQELLTKEDFESLLDNFIDIVENEYKDFFKKKKLEEILTFLEDYDSLCMDDESDRTTLAEALVKNKEIFFRTI